MKTRACLFYELLESRYCLSTFDIQGVQAAALDQPQIHALFRRSAAGTPLSASDGFGGTTFDVTGFLDTGTSATLLSQETAQGLGILSATSGGKPVVFSDVGVGGSENFDVSEPLYSALAPFFPTVDTDNAATFSTVYNQKYGPIRTEISQAPADALIGPLDIFGMPFLQGKVMVMDPLPVNSSNNMTTFVYPAGTPYHAATRDTDPGIPVTNRHVKLSYGDFSRFTLVTPTGAAGPNLNGNPFIGPDPTRALQLLPPAPDTTPPVSVSMGGLTGTGSFLFDTGAAASFISTKVAGQVGVHYKPGTYNTDAPDLVDAAGKDLPNQFIIPLGGVGGTLTVAGFFLDSMTLPTVEGQGIRFIKAPVLVADITAQDPKTGQRLTLDGDFGMNFLVASADISTGFPTNITGGAFNWVTFDQPKGLLGLDVPGATALPPVVSSAVFNDDQLPQKLSFTFGRSVTGVTASALKIVNAVTGATVTPSSVTYNAVTQTVTASFNTVGILEGRYTATLLSSAIVDSGGNHLDGAGNGVGNTNFVFSFTHLTGDANHDGVVDFRDLNTLLSYVYNTGKPGNWSVGDFNYDGVVDFKDLNLLLGSGHYGLPAPAVAASAAKSIAVRSVAPRQQVHHLKHLHLKPGSALEVFQFLKKIQKNRTASSARGPLIF